MYVRFWVVRGSLPVPGPKTVRYGGNTTCLEVRLDSGQEFLNLPMVLWPAKRFLKAGESLTATVRLDVGELEEFLMRRPLDVVKLKGGGR